MIRKFLPGLILTLMLCACGTPRDTAASPEAAAEDKPAEALQEERKPEEITAEESLKSQIHSFSGSYEETVQGKKETSGTVLTISEDGTILTVQSEDGKKALSAEIRFSDIYGMNRGAATQMTVLPAEISGLADPGVIEQQVDYMILSASVNGETYLALRELGNGTSYLSMEFFGMENEAPSIWWIFRRDGTAGTSSAEVCRNDTFYAFCWYKENEAVYLQKLDYETEESEWYGEERTALKLSREDTPSAGESVRYPVDERIQWRIFQDSESVSADRHVPELVRVTTDETGTVVKLFYMDYLGYGYYEATEPSMINYPQLLGHDPELPVRAYHPGEYMTYEDDLLKVSIGEEDGAEMIFFATQRVRDFRILNLTFQSMEKDEPVFAFEEAYYLERFLPQHPIDVKLRMIGSIPNHGISYTADGKELYFAVSASGKDGELELIPFVPETKKAEKG